MLLSSALFYLLSSNLSILLAAQVVCILAGVGFHFPRFLFRCLKIKIKKINRQTDTTITSHSYGVLLLFNLAIRRRRTLGSLGHLTDYNPLVGRRGLSARWGTGHADAPNLGGGGLGGGVLVPLLIRLVKGGRVGSSSSCSFFTSSLITRRPTSFTVLRPWLSVDTVTLPVKLDLTMHTSPLTGNYKSRPAS